MNPQSTSQPPSSPSSAPSPTTTAGPLARSLPLSSERPPKRQDVLKVKNLSVEGLRGTLPLLHLPLQGKSLCLLGENGKGKTTVVDSVEFWATGDLLAYHREDCRLDAAVHLKATEAIVTVETTGGSTSTRCLSGTTATLRGAHPPGAPAIPIMRHRTMMDLVNESPAGKARVLLGMFGLDGLSAFRRELKAARDEARRRADTTRGRLKEEQAAFTAVSGNASPVEEAARLCDLAGLTPPDTLEGLLGMALELPEGAPPAADALAAQLVQAFSRLDLQALRRWNDLVDDQRSASAQLVAQLLDAGARAVPVWPDDSCPLCLTDQPRDALILSIENRLPDLHRNAQDIRTAAKSVQGQGAAARDVRAAIERLLALDALPPLVVSHMRAWSTELERVATVAQAAVEKTEPVPISTGLPPIPTQSLVEELRPAPGLSPAQALSRLVHLQQAARSVEAVEAHANRATTVHSHLDALHTIASRHVEEAIRRAIESIGSTAARFYCHLVSAPFITGVQLEYDHRRNGGAEFSLVFDGEHTVKPPRRVVSESQLNALGLALFLARLKVIDQPWRTLVLDDVVNSFDAPHRLGLVTLLRQEFPDWQVIMATHDPAFAQVAKRVLQPGGAWEFAEIISWSPSTGPVLDDADLLEQLKTQLKKGTAASHLGSLARRLLERELALPLDRLGLSIPFKLGGRYSTKELSDAVRGGLKKIKLADADLNAANDALSYISNFGVHDRTAYEEELTRDDLAQLVTSIESLRASLHCGECKTPVWAMKETEKKKHRCSCGLLST